MAAAVLLGIGAHHFGLPRLVVWVDRTIDVTSHCPDWNFPAEKEYVLKRLTEAQAVYQKLGAGLP